MFPVFSVTYVPGCSGSAGSRARDPHSSCLRPITDAWPKVPIIGDPTLKSVTMACWAKCENGTAKTIMKGELYSTRE